jgi:hypothetical protein
LKDVPKEIKEIEIDPFYDNIKRLLINITLIPLYQITDPADSQRPRLLHDVTIIFLSKTLSIKCIHKKKKKSRINSTKVRKL